MWALLVTGYMPHIPQKVSTKFARSAIPRADAGGDELPLFDPLDGEQPFPFPLLPLAPLEGAPPPMASAVRYLFVRPTHVRMVEEAESRGGYFGHCLVAGDGPLPTIGLGDGAGMVRVGTAGVAARLTDVQWGESSGSRVATATVTPGIRFVVDEVTRTFPYPCGKIRPLRDAPPADAAAATALEGEVEAALERLLELSLKMEEKGPEAAEAAEALSAPRALLDEHKQRVLGGEYTDVTERLEAFSLRVCALVQLEHADAAAAVGTTDAAERLALVAAALRDAVGELSTLAALDQIAPATSAARSEAAAADAAFTTPSGFTPMDIPLGKKDAGEAAAEELPEGSRVEFWWNEEWGWCAATVRRTLRTGGGVLLHTLEFDEDGTREDCRLTFGDGNRRWRPVMPK